MKDKQSLAEKKQIWLYSALSCFRSVEHKEQNFLFASFPTSNLSNLNQMISGNKWAFSDLKLVLSE